MSFIVKGHQMPNHCGECMFAVQSFITQSFLFFCRLKNGKGCETEERPEWCPLVELKGGVK